MNLERLVVQIRTIHDQLAQQATKAVNLGLTLRDWLIGCHIQKYELRGEDRSEYGDRLFEVLADRLTRQGLPNCNRRQLYRYRDFYRLYPQIVGTLSPQFQKMLPALLPDEKVQTIDRGRRYDGTAVQEQFGGSGARRRSRGTARVGTLGVRRSSARYAVQRFTFDVREASTRLGAGVPRRDSTWGSHSMMGMFCGHLGSHSPQRSHLSACFSAGKNMR